MADDDRIGNTERGTKVIIQIVLIDDKDGERLKCAIQTFGGGDFEVTTFVPPTGLGRAAAFEVEADLYLVDYELDAVQLDESIANYRGTTLAARLRELKPESPVVLLTSKDLLAWTTDRRVAEASNIFDDIVYKDQEFRDDTASVKAKLLSLALNYRELRLCADRSVPALLDLLKTDEEGKEQALLSTPPDSGWKAGEAARWVRSTLLGYPGVLYDCNHAAVALGISLKSFNAPEIRKIFVPAEYRGLFCLDHKRWWRHTLINLASQFGEVKGRQFGLSEGFRLAAEETFGFPIGQSTDQQTGEGPADTICYLLDIPIRIETSLPYHPDSRPRAMDEARISFKAVQERNDVDENHLDAFHRDLMLKIRAGDYDA